jgi:hypothetical protein
VHRVQPADLFQRLLYYQWGVRHAADEPAVRHYRRDLSVLHREHAGLRFD